MKFVYKEIEGGLEIIECDTYGEEVVRIPSEIDGKPVKQLGKKLFSENRDIKVVDIPEGVERLGIDCFHSCIYLEKVTVPSTLTHIAGCCFYECKNLQHFDFLEGLVEIGYKAFAASGIESVHLPNSVVTLFDECFGDCFWLKEIVFPDNLRAIPMECCRGCKELVTVTFGKELRGIGISSFSGCVSLKNICIPEKVMYVHAHAFFKAGSNRKIIELTFKGNDLLSIEKEAFKSSHIRKAVIPDSVYYIGIEAFSDCCCLDCVRLPKNIDFTVLAEALFYGCKALTEIEIPDNVERIYDRAFSESGLKKIKFGRGIKEFGYFWKNNSLEEVEIADISKWCNVKISYLSDSPFGDGVKLMHNGTEVTTLSVPNDVTVIRKYAFAACSSLQQVVFPQSVKIIEEAAFFGCKKLAAVDMSKCKVTTLSRGLFGECIHLSSIKFPETLERVEETAFAYDAALKKVVFTNLAQINNNAFAYTDMDFLFIPDNILCVLRDAFKNAKIKVISVPENEDFTPHCHFEDDTAIFHRM